ncbi:MAG: energy-coupling factor ABC transporter substrate-binding protein [Thermoanaerobacteraceae bacterium]|nr:energy-coupling factor ABC transporter substrate-binding protein [Thermoanaerobacteraceae bacterium]
MRVGLKNAVMLLLVVVLVVSPLYLKRGAEFGGADGRAEEAISEVRPGYKPWCAPLWEPPSGEIESLLFAVQAAAGSSFVFYYLGYVKGRQRRE